MGGYNSGRSGWRGIVEQRKRLDVRTFHRRGWLRPNTAGSLHWTSDGEPNGSMSYRMERDALRLDYSIIGADDGQEQAERWFIGIERIPCRFGGCRHYWNCPRCGRRVEVVIMATDARQWGCRRCMRLRYVSQGLAPADRVQRRARLIYERLGSDDGTDFVIKPKWMRWRTFNGQMDQAEALGRYSDALFMLRLRRFGFSGDTIDYAIAGILENDDKR